MLLELKQPWKVERVDIDSVKKIVEVYIVHEKGSKLTCPVYKRDCKVYDHLGERVWRDSDSFDFVTFIATPPRISCAEHGIREAVLPLTEKTSRFSMRFEMRSMRLSWNRAWNIIDSAVKSGISMKSGHPSVAGIDGKSDKRGHGYITLVYDMGLD